MFLFESCSVGIETCLAGYLLNHRYCYPTGFYCGWSTHSDIRILVPMSCLKLWNYILSPSVPSCPSHRRRRRPLSVRRVVRPVVVVCPSSVHPAVSRRRRRRPLSVGPPRRPPPRRRPSSVRPSPSVPSSSSILCPCLIST